MLLNEECENGNGAAQFRRLLPAGALPAGISGPANVRRVPPKSVHVKAACETCRKRKIKCSGERPVCASCVKHNIACVYVSAPAETHTQALKRKYDQLQDKSSSFEELYNLMRTLPEAEAVDVVRRIRADHTDVAKVVRHVKQGCLLFQLALTPDTRFRYKFPFLQLPDMPGSLLSSDNPYLRTLCWDNPFPTAQSVQGSLDETREDSPYLRPYHAAQFYDERISKITASQWTSVAIDDQLFRDLLSAYFIYHYPTYYAFQKDLFLDDMVNNERRFCTPLLVNAILALSCHSNRSVKDREKFWDPHSLSYKFSAEARRLWEIEEISDDGAELTTVQAALLIGYEYAHNGHDKIGASFIRRVATLSNEIGLFKAAVHARIQSQKMRDACLYTAWAAFTWMSVMSYYFYREPLVIHPPEVPLPDPESNPAWYSEVLLRYPTTGAVVSMHHGHTFRAVSALRAILNDIAQEVFTRPKERQAISWNEASYFRQRLDHLFATLPNVLTPSKIVFPCHMKLHFEYHGAVYTIFNNLLAPDTDSGYYPSPTGQTMTTAAEVKTHAMEQFETIARIYFMRHCYDFPDLFLSYHFNLLATYSLDKMYSHDSLSDPDLELNRRRMLSTVFLCLKGLYEQGRYGYVCSMVYQVIHDRLCQRDRDILMSELGLGDWPEEDNTNMAMAKRCRSVFIMPAPKRVEDPKRYTLEHLVKGFSRMSIDDILNKDDDCGSGRVEEMPG